MQNNTDKIDFDNSPVVWFSIMELEAGRGNFDKAAEAKRELERLGVSVRLRGKLAKQIAGAEQKPTLGESHE